MSNQQEPGNDRLSGEPSFGRPIESTPEFDVRSPSSGRATGRALVGRHEAFGELNALWAKAVSGGERVEAFVLGPDGFGKSSLFHRFLVEVSGPVVMRAICEEDEGSVEFAMLGQLLRGIDLPDPSPLATLGHGRGEDLDPLRVGAALLELFDDLGAGGLIVAVDDVHWADPQSARALVFALRRLWRSPVFTVLCCDAAEEHRLPASLGRLVNDTAVRVELAPLQVEDVEELASHLGISSLNRAGVVRIVEYSGGSPLHVRALLNELSVDEINDSSRPLRAPATYADLVKRRLATCEPSTVALIEAAAVLGDAAPLAATARLAGVADPSPAFDQAVGVGIVSPGLVDRVGFVHPLTRSAVFHAMGRTRRDHLHRGAARLLAVTNAGAALDHRVAATLSFDPDLAADVMTQAGADAAAGSWATAAERFRVAASLSEPGSALMERATLGMVDCLALEGDLSVLRVAEDTIGALERSALKRYALGRMCGLAADWIPAERHLQAAWQLVDGDRQPEAASRICGESARAAIVGGRGGEALDWLDKAMSAATTDASLQNDLMAMWALAMGIQGRSDEALDAFAAMPEPDVDPTSGELDQISGRGMLRLWHGDVAQARADLSMVVRATRRRGPIHSNLYASQYLADAAYRMGDWDQAIVTAEDAAAAARDLGNAWALPMLHAVASFPHSGRGEFDAAAAHVTAAAEAIVSDGDVPNRLWAALADARLAQARRDADGVVTALAPIAEMAHLDGVREPGVQPWQPLLAAALTVSGALEESTLLLDTLATIAVDRRLAVPQVAVERERARVRAVADPPGALAVMEEAVDRADAISTHPFERARFDLLHGQILRQVDKREEAMTVLYRAQTACAALGAKPWLDDIETELALCGAQPDAERWNSIEATAHELRVARLVAEGMTNRQVAAELVVSVKTVGYHLSNIYSKLGVHSRIQMANALADQLGQPGRGSDDRSL